MKKLLYYSPFIPIVGVITHFFWIVFRYEIYSMNEKAPRGIIPMVLQGIYISILYYLFKIQ